MAGSVQQDTFPKVLELSGRLSNPTCWAQIKPQLQTDLRAGTYRFSAVHRFGSDEGAVKVWAALDALVLKAMAIVLTRRLKPHLSEHCYHLAGNGGGKAAVRAVAANLAGNTFVFRTDVKSYYASIDHAVLLEMLRPLIPDERVLDLLWQYLHRTLYDDGLYREVKRGICLGCPLSPLMGALYLHRLDERVAALGLFYARFMDDWVVLAPTRWKLRKAIEVVIHYPTQGEKPGFLPSEPINCCFSSVLEHPKMLHQAKNLVSDVQCRVMRSGEPDPGRVEGGAAPRQDLYRANRAWI